MNSKSFFPDMTIQQIAALSEVEVSKVVNLACAEQGIPIFLESIGEEPKQSVPPDVEYFKIGDWIVGSIEHASAIVKAIDSGDRYTKAYDPKTYSSLDVAERSKAKIEIEPLRLFSPEQYHKCQSEIRAHKQAHTAWEARKRATELSTSNRSTIAENVWREVWDAQEQVSEHERIDRPFAKYVELADGNHEMARKFLITAERLDESWRPGEAAKALAAPVDVQSIEF